MEKTSWHHRRLLVGAPASSETRQLEDEADQTSKARYIKAQWLHRQLEIHEVLQAQSNIDVGSQDFKF